MAKASKRRHCPALGREITPADCGEDRNRRIACASACEFNPFNPANYAQLLEIEDKLDHKTMDRLAGEAGDRMAFVRQVEQALKHASGHADHAFVAGRAFFTRDQTGLTFAQQWEKVGYAGLRNDERALFAAKAQMRIAALEIRCVVDEQFVEAVDLLAPERGTMRFLDRSLATRATRFAVIIAWIFPLPHFWRLSGTAIVLTDMGGPSQEEVVTETLRHLGAPEGDDAARQAWLAENFLRIDASIVATAKERRRLMLDGMDGEWCEGQYDLAKPAAQLELALRDEPAVDRDQLADTERTAGFTEAWAWFDDSKTKDLATPAGGRQLLGSVLAAKGRCQIQATGRGRYEELRRRFEAKCGALVRFTGERRQNKAAQLAGAVKTADRALVPPRLLENPQQVRLASSRIAGPGPGETLADVQSRYIQESLRRFLDEPIPALDGRTPRVAAGDPQWRAPLVGLLKPQVRRIDEENLRTGRCDDINWLIRELGLAEIDFPPPPPRAVPEVDGELEGDVDLDDADERDGWNEGVEAPFSDAGSPLADASDWRTGLPALRLSPPGAREPSGRAPVGALSFDECHERMNAVFMQFDSPAAAAKALDASGSDILEDLSALTAELVDEKQLGLLLLALFPGWFSLVRPGAPAPQLDYDRMEESFDRELDTLPVAAKAGAEVMLAQLLAGCGQPLLLQALIGHFHELVSKLPKKLRPKVEEQLAMTIALKVVITELDRVQRE